MKLATGNLGALNPDDIQVLTDIVIEIAEVDLTPVSDDLAAAFVATLRANQINSFDDLSEVAQRAAEDPSTLVIPPEVFESRDDLERLLTELSDPAVQQALQQRLNELREQVDL